MHAPENELHSMHAGMTQIEKHRPPYRHVAPKLTLSHEHRECRRRPVYDIDCYFASFEIQIVSDAMELVYSYIYVFSSIYICA